MKKYISLFSLFLLYSTNSYAVTNAGVSISNTLDDLWSPVYLLAAILFVVSGLLVMVKGLMKLKDSSERGGSSGEAIAIVFIGAILLAIPTAAGMGIETFIGGNGMSSSYASTSVVIDSGSSGISLDNLKVKGDIGTPENCLSSEQPTVCMASNIASNLVPISIKAAFATAFLVGFLMFGSGFIEITKGLASGQGGRLPQGVAVKIVIAILLMNSGYLFSLATATLIGTTSTVTDIGLNSSSGMLTYTASSTSTLNQNMAILISKCFIILTFFGTWAFLRGILMLKNASEGKNQGTIAMGMVYIVAGILMANAQYSSCMILRSVGGSDLNTGLCSSV